MSGTDFNDPPELRKVLRDNFTWDKKRQVWEYNAKKGPARRRRPRPSGTCWPGWTASRRPPRL